MKLTKIGNSRGIVIPRETLRAWRISPDAELTAVVDGNRLILQEGHSDDAELFDTLWRAVLDEDRAIFEALAQ